MTCEALCSLIVLKLATTVGFQRRCHWHADNYHSHQYLSKCESSRYPQFAKKKIIIIIIIKWKKIRLSCLNCSNIFHKILYYWLLCPFNGKFLCFIKLYQYPAEFANWSSHCVMYRRRFPVRDTPNYTGTRDSKLRVLDLWSHAFLKILQIWPTYKLCH
jgi:hypothetical protein